MSSGQSSSFPLSLDPLVLIVFGLSVFHFCPSTEVKGIACHNFMATSEGHNLNEGIQGPVSTHFAPIPSPPLESRGPAEKRLASTSPERPVRRLAPRKGSSRREAHIPRPRNPFMIFRSEYLAQEKITNDVERDHRHISRIVGHLWNNTSEEDKAPYRLMAEQEKLEHRRKYPGWFLDHLFQLLPLICC